MEFTETRALCTKYCQKHDRFLKPNWRHFKKPYGNPFNNSRRLRSAVLKQALKQVLNEPGCETNAGDE